LPLSLYLKAKLVFVKDNKVDLLIIDDWGLSRLNEMERKDFLEIIEERQC